MPGFMTTLMHESCLSRDFHDRRNDGPAVAGVNSRTELSFHKRCVAIMTAPSQEPRALAGVEPAAVK